VLGLAVEANSIAMCDDDVNGATARGKDMVGLKDMFYRGKVEDG
jgi:hypothetical protein